MSKGVPEGYEHFLYIYMCVCVCVCIPLYFMVRGLQIGFWKWCCKGWVWKGMIIVQGLGKLFLCIFNIFGEAAIRYIYWKKVARYQRREKWFRKTECCATNKELKQDRFDLGFVLSSFMIQVMRLRRGSSIYIYINLIIENLMCENW